MRFSKGVRMVVRLVAGWSLTNAKRSERGVTSVSHHSNPADQEALDRLIEYNLADVEDLAELLGIVLRMMARSWK